MIKEILFVVGAVFAVSAIMEILRRFWILWKDVQLCKMHIRFLEKLHKIEPTSGTCDWEDREK